MSSNGKDDRRDPFTEQPYSELTRLSLFDQVDPFTPLSPAINHQYGNLAPSQGNSHSGESEENEISTPSGRYDRPITFRLEDEEGIPLKEAPFDSHMGGFRPEAGGLAPSEPDLNSVANFGFPVPDLPDGHHDSRYNGTSTSNLYRTQTTTEAWGRRQRIDPKRAKTVKVKLQHGNFVNEYPVPSEFRRATQYLM